jgi:hypothetical protein
MSRFGEGLWLNRCEAAGSVDDSAVSASDCGRLLYLSRATVPAAREETGRYCPARAKAIKVHLPHAKQYMPRQGILAIESVVRHGEDGQGPPVRPSGIVTSPEARGVLTKRARKIVLGVRTSLHPWQ